MGGLMLAFLAEVGIITYRDIAGSEANRTAHTVAGLPLPADYMAAILAYGVLGAVPPSSGAYKVSSLLGWGIVLATLMNVLPGTPKGGASAPAPTATTTTKASTTTGTQGGLI